MGCAAGSGAPAVPGGYLEELKGEFTDFLPYPGLMPDLTPEEVRRFVALGEFGWERYREGDETGAETAFRAQIATFPANPEPFVSLALVQAGRGEKEQAVKSLRAAVVRGFTDMRRLDRAEAWTRLKDSVAVRRLRDTIPILFGVERRWDSWRSYRSSRPPEDLDRLFRSRERVAARIEEMAPALGSRLVQLWHRSLDRSLASMLEAYVTERPDAPDLETALGRLMDLYSGGGMLRWERIPAEAAGKLSKVAATVLDRFPESSMRPVALVGRAVAGNSERDRKGRLSPEAAVEIRASLEEVIRDHAASPVLAVAVAGLLHVETEAGETARAEELYETFRKRHGGDEALLGAVREGLGDLALILGGLPGFHATALDGSVVDADSLRGRITVIDFWATWCKPCIDGFPTLRKIAERHDGEVAMVGVNMDRADDCSEEQLLHWIEHQQLPGRQIHDGQAWESDLVSAFGVKEIPFTVVVGPAGEVLAVNRHGKALEKTVRAAVRDHSAVLQASASVKPKK